MRLNRVYGGLIGHPFAGVTNHLFVYRPSDHVGSLINALVECVKEIDGYNSIPFIIAGDRKC